MVLGTNFRQKLLALAVLPLVVGQLVMLFAVMETAEKDVDQRARNSLQIGAEVVKQYLASRSDQINTSVQVLAADFGLKEAAVTGDEGTIRSVLHNHSLRVGADVAMLLSIDGHVIANTDQRTDQWRIDFSDVIADDGSRGSRQLLASVGSEIYQAFIVPLRAPVTVGWIVVGFQVDNAIVDRMANLTGLGVAVVDMQQHAVVVASADWPQVEGAGDSPLLAPTMPIDSVYLSGDMDDHRLVLGTRLLASDDRILLVLTRSLHEAMAPYLDARRSLLIFAFVLLSLVAIGAAWVSGGIAKPLRMLTAAARRMSSGQYDALVKVASDDEFGELAASFNAMGAAIAEREKRISHQTMHDPLTNLPNRSLIVRQLSQGIEVGRGKSLAVISIRLSRMNKISTTLGPSASDELILAAAGQLQLDLKSGDLLGHVDSHQFVVVLFGCDASQALASAENILNSLASGVMLGRINISLPTEIGIAMYPQHADTASSLLRNATIARSEAHFGTEPIAVYEAGREDFYVRQLRIVNELRSAIQSDQLLVYYQPKLSLASGSVCGAEALVRWEHPEFGFLPPDEFIPAAEEAGSIQMLTRFVLTRAIEDCRKWEAAGHELQVSVNISARDLLDDYLPSFVSRLLKEHRLPANRLTLEVTESTVMHKLQKAIFVLECLRELGVRIAMDDFGTGQSSLAQLKNIPFQELKIDKSFIMTLCSDMHSQAIVRTTLQLAENMQLDVIAEGVEDAQTMLYLADAGCQQVQGYHISKPIPFREMMQWLAGRRDASPAKRTGAHPLFAEKSA